MAFTASTTIFISLLCLIAMGLATYFAIRTRNMRRTVKTETPKLEIKEYIEQLLQHLNCQYKIEENKGWFEYCFKYQSGNFILICKENNYHVRIHYPNFMTTKIDELDLVRETCNTCNTRYFQHHVVYTTNGENNQVSLHITSGIAIANKDNLYQEILGDTLSHFFTVAHDFYVHFNVLKEKYHDRTPYDIEKDYLKYERDFFILKEMEVFHNESNRENHYDAEHTMTIAALVQKFYSYDKPEYLELKIVTHQLQTLVTEKEIQEFDINHVLIKVDHEGLPNFCGRNAHLILTFYPDRNNTEGYPQQLTIALNNEGRTDSALYQRITMSMPKESPHQKNSTYADYNKERLFSFIVAYETASNISKRKELFTLLKDTEQKVANKDFAHLTKDQRLIIQLTTPDIQTYKEYANQLFREKRYYEAIHEFEYLYNFLSGYYQTFNKIQQEFFYNICYYLGVSYSQLGLHKQAYNYLDIIFPLNNIAYMEAYVNNLVNAQDFRSLSIIDNIYESIQNQLQSNGGEIPENIRRFQHFLLRRKAYHLTDLGYYSEAKKIYELLYQEPECQDAALNELAYLQNLCKTGDENKDQE